jgi:uncharacterized pyridoxamine 5'-phosphate oxidase family protein
MDRVTFERESALNRAAYEQLRSSIPVEFVGQYVAMAHGRVVGSAPSFDDALAIVKSLVPPPEYYTVFSADDEPDFELNYDLSGCG